MHDFIFTGTVVGILLGLMHTAYLAKVVTSSNDATATKTWLPALNYAGWTMLLWFLLGAYVLGFWLIGLVFYLAFKAFR